MCSANGISPRYKATNNVQSSFTTRPTQKLISAGPRSAEYTIGICFATVKNTKAFECFVTGFQRSLWKFNTTGNLYSLKSWLWFAAVVCVVRWPISNALLNDTLVTCFTQMCNWNYWHKHHGFMINSILGHFDHSQLAPFTRDELY